MIDTTITILEPALIVPYPFASDDIIKTNKRRKPRKTKNKESRFSIEPIKQLDEPISQPIPFIPSSIDVMFYIRQSSFIGIQSLNFLKTNLIASSNEKVIFQECDDDDKNFEKPISFYKKVIQRKEQTSNLLLLSFNPYLLNQYIQGKRTFSFRYVFPIYLHKTNKKENIQILYADIKTMPIDIINMKYSEIKQDKLNQTIGFSDGIITIPLNYATNKMITDYVIKSAISHPLFIYDYYTYNHILNNNILVYDNTEQYNKYSTLFIQYINHYKLSNGQSFKIQEPIYKIYEQLSKENL